MTVLGWIELLILTQLVLWLGRRQGIVLDVKLAPFTHEWEGVYFLPRFTRNEWDDGEEKNAVITCYRTVALWGAILFLRYSFAWNRVIWRMTKEENAKLRELAPRYQVSDNGTVLENPEDKIRYEHFKQKFTSRRSMR